MKSNFFYWLDRLYNSFMLRYRKEVFLSKIGSTENSLTVLGRFSVDRCKSLVVGKDVSIYPNVSFSGGGKITLGDNVQIGEGSILYSHKSITIGSNVAIAGQCYIIDCNHGIAKGEIIQKQELEYSENGIYIGNDVWIAAGCKIVKGAKINDGCVIGALSLVNSEIEKDGIAVGIPAKVIKYRT